MGQPVKIVDLAERMIRLSGLEPGRDIEIVFTGMRPGERLHEILFAREEPIVEIGIAGIVAARPVQPSLEAMRAMARHARAGPRARGARGDLPRAARRGAGFPRRGGLNHRGDRGLGIGHRLPAGGDQLVGLGDQRADEALGHLALSGEA